MVTGPGRKWNGATGKLAMLPAAFGNDGDREDVDWGGDEGEVGEERRVGGDAVDGRVHLGSERILEAESARQLFL
jgi:hypothetical protein